MRSSHSSRAAACALALGLGAACGSSDGGGGSAAACSFPAVVPASAGSQVIGHFTAVGVGQSVSFTVPPDTVGLTVIEQAASSVPNTITFTPAGRQPFTLSNTAVPLRILDPSGSVVYDDSTFPADPEAARAFFASDSPFTGTLTLPNTSAGLDEVGSSSAQELPAGAWSLVVSDFAYECSLPQANGDTCSGGTASGAYDVVVLARTSSAGVPPSGTLDVVVHFATTQTGDPARPLPSDAAALRADPDVRRLGESLTALLANGGLAANVTFDLLDAATRARFQAGVNVDDAVGPCSGLSQLFRSVPANASPAVNVFVVSDLHGGASNGNIVVGIDGSIPGPAGLPGTVASGAAVGSTDLRTTSRTNPNACAVAGPDFANCGDDQTAYILAHEIGHYLGLYHTTESDGASFDPLRDTPQCGCGACSASPTACGTANAEVNVAACLGGAAPSGCGGGDNLMFWQFSRTGSTGTLTAEQGAIMRANPVVH